MTDWRDDDPWWPEKDHLIEVEVATGQKITGRLTAWDSLTIESGPDAGDEVPIFSIDFGAGSREWFAEPEVVRWRVLTPPDSDTAAPDRSQERQEIRES